MAGPIGTLGGSLPGFLEAISGSAYILRIVLWQLVGELVGSAIAPYVAILTQESFRSHPVNALTAAEAAEAVIRNLMDFASAAAEASRTGIDEERFRTLVGLAGNAPAPEAMAEALRRGFVDEATYLKGIRQGRLRDEWAELVKKLATRDPSPMDALDAYLEGQLEEETAREYFVKFGGNPEHFQWLYNTRGSAPTPVQAADMANRGIIPWEGRGPEVLSFEQAFLEGPWRNKWLPAFRQAAEYLPPPRTIVAMVREGSLSHDRAIELLRKNGLAPDLAEAYLVSASAQRTQGAKDLTEAQVRTLYRDRLIPRSTAHDLLVSLGYDAQEADWLLATVEVEIAHRYLSTAVSRIHSLYVGHRLSRADAVVFLQKLGLESAEVDDLLGLWEWERAANVRLLTPSEIAQAFRYEILTQEEAQAALEALGYTPHDAWVYLSIHAKGPLPNEPAKTALAPGPTPA